MLCTGLNTKLVYNTFHRSNLAGLLSALVDPVWLNYSQRRIVPMGGEMFTTIILSSSLILVGIVMGYLLLKVQGDSEEEL